MSSAGVNVRRSRVNAKGRNSDRVGNGGRVLIMRRPLVQSPQWSALSSNSRALLIELLSMFNGKNRDTLFLSVRDAADRVGLSDLKAVGKAFDQLCRLGFIQESAAASFRQKFDEKSRARSWRLLIVDAGGRPLGRECLPDLEFSELTTREKRAVARRTKALDRYLKNYTDGRFAVEDSTTFTARAELAVEKSSTLKTENGTNRPTAMVEKIATHIEYHRGTGSGGAIAQPESKWWASVERCLARASAVSSTLLSDDSKVQAA